MSTLKSSSIDLKNISPMVKKTVKEWVKEVLAANRSEFRRDSVKSLYKRLNEALAKEYSDKGLEYVKEKFDELKPQVDFLASLFYCINDDLRNRQREMQLEVDWLTERLKRLLMALQASSLAQAVDTTFAREAYPLSEEMADLLWSLNERTVRTWDEMLASELPAMVREYFLLQGNRAIPWGWDLMRQILVNSGEESKIAAICSKFESPEDGDDFLHGRDFNYGLLDVRDEDFETALESLLEEVRSLVNSGAVEAGWVLCPKDPPNLFMSSIPLIEGNWIDKKALAVLEWYQSILKMGYEIIRPEEENPVAWPIVLDKRTQDEEAVQGVIVKVEDFGILNKDEQYAIFIEAEERINSLGLQERIIDGRVYVCLADYFDSTGHLLCNEDFEIKDGIMINSWNRWIKERQSGECESGDRVYIGKFPASEMSCAINLRDIQRIPSLEEAFGLQEMREKCIVLSSKLKISSSSVPFDLREKGIEDGIYIYPCFGDDEPIRASLARWRDDAFNGLVRYFALYMATLTLSVNLFEAGDILFKDLENKVSLTISKILTLSSYYDDTFADLLDKLKTVKKLTWSDASPYGWAALFPKGFSVDLGALQKAAEASYMTYYDMYINMAHESLWATGSDL